jgi:hypothetical protein
MRDNFSKQIVYEGKTRRVIVVPTYRADGNYYEINVKGMPRFYMGWSALGRYDIVKEEGVAIPYDIVLAVSDIIEEMEKKS